MKYFPRALTMTIVLAATLQTPATAPAAANPICHGHVNLTLATLDCAENSLRPASPQGITYPRWSKRLSLACDDDTPNAVGSCINTAPCLLPDGTPGIRHLIHERQETAPGQFAEWTFAGETCRTTPTQGEGTPAISETGVTSAFKRLAWPKAELHIQPAGGTTLVNKNTHAHTTNPGPVTKDTTLLGQRVTIEATSISWTWHWGDGTSDTTDHPGAPHPDAITHTYTKASPRLRPRVDVTYQGRYRVNGSAWQPLTNTHTVAGDQQPLEVREAISQLVR